MAGIQIRAFQIIYSFKTRAATDDFVDAGPMGRYFIVEEVSEQGRVEIGRLEAGEVVVGREPGEPGVKVDNTAISRQHGVFIKCGLHWLYKDLGSTNGSWLNGARVQPEHLRLVRPGDLLQLADSALGLQETSDGGADRGDFSAKGGIGGRSLLTFRKGGFIREYPVPEYGRSLVIGGSSPDLEIEGDLFELPSLVVERRGENVCVYSPAKELPVFVNEQELSETVNLKDGDEVVISDYLILLNDPTSLQAPGSAAQKKGESESSPTNLRKWFDEQPSPHGTAKPALTSGAARPSKAVRKSVFGQRPQDMDDSDETMPIDVRGLAKGGGLRGSGLYGRSQAPQAYSLASLETKILLGVFFVVVLAIMLLVIWWAMS